MLSTDHFNISMSSPCMTKHLTFKVMATKPGTPLYVEFSKEVIQFVRDMATQQQESGDIVRMHRRATVSEPVTIPKAGVSYSYVRQQFRVSFTKNGKKSSKYVGRKGCYDGIDAAMQVKDEVDSLDQVDSLDSEM